MCRRLSRRIVTSTGNIRRNRGISVRGHITKSKAGHYTVSLRNERGELMSIHDKLPTLHAVRGLLAVMKRKQSPAAYLATDHRNT